MASSIRWLLSAAEILDGQTTLGKGFLWLNMNQTVRFPSACVCVVVYCLKASYPARSVFPPDDYRSWSTQTWHVFMNLFMVLRYLFNAFWASLRVWRPCGVAARLTLSPSSHLPVNLKHSSFFEPVSVLPIDFVDYGCNQRWPFPRSQQISLHTFQPTHTPPHTLLLCSHIKCICAVGLGESLCYICKTFQGFGFIFIDHAELQKPGR